MKLINIVFPELFVKDTNEYANVRVAARQSWLTSFSFILRDSGSNLSKDNLWAKNC
jgi:hypothetical protein